MIITCAFCKGKGKDQFNLLSELAICQVCRGAGKIEVDEPVIKCAYCKGSGVYPQGARVTCTVCNGKGSVTVTDRTDECPKCKNTGRETDSGLPCIQCRGRGVILNI